MKKLANLGFTKENNYLNRTPFGVITLLLEKKTDHDIILDLMEDTFFSDSLLRNDNKWLDKQYNKKIINSKFYNSFYRSFNNNNIMKRKIFYIVVILVLLVSSCAMLSEWQVTQQKEYMALPNYIYRTPEETVKMLGKPNETSKYDSGTYHSLTYTYFCIRGKYISIDYERVNGTYYFQSIYTSNGICKKLIK